MEKIVITGRANVGKSTLFNKISKRRISIVENIPGITRDVIESKAVFQDKVFKLVDTGGLTDSKEEISQAIRDKVLKLYKEAYKIIFVVDGKAGLMPEDKDIAKLLYPYKEKVYVAVNKTDSKKASASEFYELGFDNVFEISATHGTGVFELLEEITKDLPSMEEIEEKANFVKLSFIGKPNSGKSSLLNSILKQDRVIVSNIAGTTRDAVDVEFSYEGKDFILVDTAGIRRPSNIDYGIEFFAVNRSLEAIEKSDVCALVIDATEGVSRQDMRLASLVNRKGKGLIVVLNKIDLIKEIEALKKHVDKKLEFVYFAPRVYVSAKEGINVFSILQKAIDIYEEYSRPIKTSYVNRTVEKILEEYPQNSTKPINVYYTVFSPKPPTIVLHTNNKDFWREDYLRFFEKKLREKLNINYAPLNIILKEHQKKEV